MEVAAEKPMFRMEGFSWLERWYSGSKQPADGVLVELSFKDIPKDAKQIDSLEGTVEVLTEGDEKQVAIKDLSDRKNGPVESPVLKAAGLNISFNREVSQLDDDAYVGITMPVDERNTFAGLRLVDATGSLSNRSSQFSFDGSTFGCGYRIEKTDLAKTGLVILVRVGGELKTIPFRAENVIIE